MWWFGILPRSRCPKPLSPSPTEWLSVAVGNFFSRPPSPTPAEEEPPAHHGTKLATLKGHAHRVNALTVTLMECMRFGAEEAKLWRLDRLSQPAESDAASMDGVWGCQS